MFYLNLRKTKMCVCGGTVEVGLLALLFGGIATLIRKIFKKGTK